MTSPPSYDRLRELLEAATPGQWSVSPFYAGVISDRFGKDGDFLPIALMLWPTDERTEAETYANAALVVEARAALPDLLTRIADLESSVVAFGSVWAVDYARRIGLPDGHLHPGHYAILKDAGARMDDFQPAALRALSGTDTGEKVGG